MSFWGTQFNHNKDEPSWAKEMKKTAEDDLPKDSRVHSFDTKPWDPAKGVWAPYAEQQEGTVGSQTEGMVCGRH